MSAITKSEALSVKLIEVAHRVRDAAFDARITQNATESLWAQLSTGDDIADETDFENVIDAACFWQKHHAKAVARLLKETKKLNALFDAFPIPSVAQLD